MTELLTDTIWDKYEFTDEENTELAQQMARAEAVISEKSDDLRAVTAAIKAEITTQEGILHSCAEKLRSGYEMRQKVVDLRYDYGNGVVQYIDKESGEILKERPMTKDEQLRLTEQTTDAEDIVRQASQEEDEAAAAAAAEAEEDE